MPVIFKEKVYPTGYAGGIMDLNTLHKLSIKVTIRFPYTDNGTSFDLKPLTVNLLTDIGLSPDAHAYVVKWGDNRPDTDTISNSMSPFKHEHTYEPGRQTSKTMIYTIEVYSDTVIKFWPFDKSVGSEPNGFSIHAVATTSTTKGFISRIVRDRSIKDGARISRGWFGTKLFYQRDVSGSLAIFDIILDGSSNEVRLVNPLTVGMNNWENIRTDMVIDWGDGNKTQFYDKKINSMVFNTGSKHIPSHTYKASTGSRFTIKVKSVEPVVPIGCKLDSMYGTLPEDVYIGNSMGLFRYTEGEKTEWRNKISKHIEEVRYLGSSLLDKWKNTTNMDYTFKDWNKLVTVPDYFFKENILSVCTSYKETFRNTENLILCDEYLLGETNDVIVYANNMFKGSGIGETIKLKNATNLKTVIGMYQDSKVTKSYDFLVNVPSLTDSSLLFSQSTLKDYSDTMLANSPLVRSVNSIFYKTKISQILINMKQWGYIEDLQQAYAYTPLARIQNGIFGGDFGTKLNNNTIRMTSIFRGIGTDDVYTDVDPDVFKSLSNISKKLYSVQSSWFYGAKIQTLHEGMFDDVFRHWKDFDETKATEARFGLDSMFTGLKTKDNFGYAEPCIKIPRMFRNGFGIDSIYCLFSGTKIGYIDPMAIQDIINVKNVRGLFWNGSLYTKIPNDIFKNLRHINNLYETFQLIYYKFSDTPLDRILYVEGNHEIDCTGMFNHDQVRMYRLFNNDSNFTGRINLQFGDDLIRNQSLPQSVIINGVQSNIKDPNKFTIRPLIIHCVATENTTVTMSNGTNADIVIDGAKSTVTLPHTFNLTKGNHTIEVISTTAVIVDGNDFYVTALDGEYPYNSTIPDYPSCYTLREIGQFVYAVCDADSVHSKNRLMYIPIIHKNIFNYHDRVTRTNFMSTTDNLMKSAYGLQPRIYHHMYGLTTFDNMFNTSIPVISDIALPQLGKDISANLLSSIDSEEFVTTNIHASDLVYNGKLTSLSFGKAQINVPRGENNPGRRKKEEYLEMRLEGSNSPLQIVKLIGEPTLPIIVETVSKGQIKPVKHVLNTLSDTINVTGDFYVRIYSDKPVWINNKTAITELYGVIPPCNFTPQFISIAPNLRRVGANIFIRCTNTSFANTFKGLKQFEYFPGTLFWYSYNAVDYESCFADCPKLFKVDDYIITDKIGNINCKNMFANSGVKNVRRPIADDIMGKVDITGMFTGCVTGYFYAETDIDNKMFYNVDIYGRSGIRFSGTNSVHANLDNRYVCLDPSSSDMDVTYFIPEGLLHSDTTRWESLNYASQALPNQVLDIDNKHLDPNKHITRYLPFLSWLDPFASVVENNIPNDFYSYCEFLKSALVVDYKVAKEFPKLAMWRNNNIVTISGAYQSSKFTNTNIADTMPFDCGSLMEADLTYANSTGITVNSDWKMPRNVLRNAVSMFENTNLVFGKGSFSDVDVNGLGVRQTDISNMFKGNKNQVEETGIFKAFGRYLGPVITGVYWDTSIVNIDENMFKDCDMEVMDSIFRNTHINKLPIINHMTKAYSYQHMFERTAVMDIPYGYIYTTRTDRDIMIDYMFANCANIFLSSQFIDSRSKGHFSIDYSLNEVLSGIGGDPDIFGNINYDKDPEHRSRVNPFDSKIVWMQIVETFKPNVSVKLEGFYRKNLAGLNLTKTMTIMWDDELPPVMISAGTAVTDDKISYTYPTAGRHRIRVMLEGELCYLPTPIERKADIVTVDLPTSFKFGNITDIRDRGLFSMFGDGVEHVTKTLFDELEGVDTIEVYNDMFTKFSNLTNLEPGVLDCMPNLRVMKNFLYNSKGSRELTLRTGLLDKLTKLTDIENFAFRSNVSSVEAHMFDNNTLLNSMLYGFTESKLTELPRDLLSKLTALNNVGRLVAWCNNFVLDESYSNFFANNGNIEWASGAFMGVKINAIPTNIMKPLVKAVTVAEMFATDHQLVSSEPWNDGDSEVKLDVNDLHIPSGFLSANTKLQETANMFAGRKSLKSYPDGLLDTCKALNNTRCMFMQTGITQIHSGTFDGFTNNIDVEYMFYGCRVRLCPKPIINSTGVFKTLGMLYKVTGILPESELFNGVKTNPSNIQSMYRQELEYYNMEGTFSGNLYIKAIEANTFPWNGYAIDIDPGDGNVITIETDIPNQAKLTELTSFTPKGSTIKVKAPFAIELAGGTASYTRLSGVFGRMSTNSHIRFGNTGYKDSVLTIDDDNFYKRNTHLTSLNNAFSQTQIAYVKTNAFKYLDKVTTMIQAFYSTPNFKIKDGYKPNFDHMKLTDITESFGSTLSLVVNKDWEPFANIGTIVKAKSVFNSSGIITTPRINTDRLEDASYAYWMCSNLTTTYADIFDWAAQCYNFSGAFGYTPKLTIIEGERDDFSIASSPSTHVSVYGHDSINYSSMFINSGLSQEQIVRIINNLGGWKTVSPLNINIAEMFKDTNRQAKSGNKPGIKIKAADKKVHAENAFYNTRIMNVPKDAIVLTGDSRLTFRSMFYNCFASPEVEVLEEVFSIPGETDDTDFRPSELDTLNVFRISVTPEQTVNIMSDVEIANNSIVDDVAEIKNSDTSTNLSDSAITDNVKETQINSTNVSNEIIVDNIEEEIE